MLWTNHALERWQERFPDRDLMAIAALASTTKPSKVELMNIMKSTNAAREFNRDNRNFPGEVRYLLSRCGVVFVVSMETERERCAVITVFEYRIAWGSKAKVERKPKLYFKRGMPRYG